MHARILLTPVWTCCVLCGCGVSTPDQPDSDEPEVEAKPQNLLPLKKVDAAKLPKLAGYLDLRAAKLKAAPPGGWLPKGRHKEYLAAFVKNRNAVIPSIVLKLAEPIGGDAFKDVTPENVVDFTEAVQATLQDPLESARPMVIGEHAFARHVKAARIGNLPAEVQVLNTIRDGKMYSIELRVRDVEDLKKHRDSAYAVAAGLQFDADDKPFDFQPEAVPVEPMPDAANPTPPPTAEPPNPAAAP